MIIQSTQICYIDHSSLKAWMRILNGYNEVIQLRKTDAPLPDSSDNIIKIRGNIDVYLEGYSIPMMPGAMLLGPDSICQKVLDNDPIAFLNNECIITFKSINNDGSKLYIDKPYRYVYNNSSGVEAIARFPGTRIYLIPDLMTLSYQTIGNFNCPMIKQNGSWKRVNTNAYISDVTHQ
jgi:hypothetical protein